MLEASLNLGWEAVKANNAPIKFKYTPDPATPRLAQTLQVSLWEQDTNTPLPSLILSFW